MEEHKDLMIKKEDVDELLDSLHSIDLVDSLSKQGNEKNITLTVLEHKCTKLKIHPEKNHQLPHFHIEYKQEHTASYAIDDFSILAGEMPKKYEKPIIKWAKKKQNSLKATWDKLQTGKDVRELILVSEKKSIF